MTHPAKTTANHLRAAVAVLLAAHESIGPEHQALAAEAEEQQDTADRRATVRRMSEALAEADRLILSTVKLLATVHGLRDLGVDGQQAKGVDSSEYIALPPADSPDPTLSVAAASLRSAVQQMVKVFTPTRKHSDLAYARRPQETLRVFSCIREAFTSLRDELVAQALADDAGDVKHGLGILDDLDAQVPSVPAPAAPLTASAIRAAILTDPVAACVAADTLERMR